MGSFSAVAAATAVSLIYVAVLYIRRDLPRDNPHKIKLRAYGVTGACAVAWLPLAFSYTNETSVASLLGLRWQGLGAALVVPPLLTSVAFAAPLLHMRFDLKLLDVLALLRAGDLMAWRDVVIAPLAEEFVFRACMLPLFLLEGYSASAAVLLAPLFFGAAHLHHLRELLLHGGCSWRRALLQVSFQFLYTTIYGWYAAFLFATTAHYAAPVAAHVLCNIMGVPDLPGMLSSGRPAAYVALLLAGLLGFALLLPHATQPGLYGNTVFQLQWWGER